MVRARHAAEPFAGIDQNGLWSLEGLARLQQPREIKRVNPDIYAGCTELLNLGNSCEAAAVYKAEAVYIAVIFIRTRTQQRQKRIELMTA
ncbi:hypothetical protein D3C80_1577830 [compost metagenome]